MNTGWFVRKGIFFVPVHPVGWTILFGTVVFSVYTFMDIDKVSHSVSDTLMNFAFNLLILFIGYSFCGWMMMRKTKSEE